ncbi:hypothetical protein [Komagataeibacter intermedius]|uniref:hypothetical protein n=1 Tax=Komagataeibacter intermedius TaxID=66229 RepID=UPI000A7D601B
MDQGRVTPVGHVATRQMTPAPAMHRACRPVNEVFRIYPAPAGHPHPTVWRDDPSSPP